jgi:transposase, IS30 family
MRLFTKRKNDKHRKIMELIRMDERPVEVADQSVVGYFEGDLIFGNGYKPSIRTLEERKTRTVILVNIKSQKHDDYQKCL